ncbi:UDP-glucose 4-epimerase [compost metagenome]
MNVLVTGGAGYIGSHTVLQLLQRGFAVTVLDNFCNSSELALDRVADLAGSRPQIVKADILDKVALAKVFAEQAFDAVIHFAGLKAVGESVSNPLSYYQSNVGGTLNLVEAMAAAGVFRLVFSSSATVYGVPEIVPIREASKRGATNPYGQSKLIVEQILEDVGKADTRWSIINLRYFNPVGAHPSGYIGEDPSGIPNNLVPFVTQVACGRREVLSIFGGDYPTNDGTGVRDYIHVVDVASGHLAALEWLGGEAAKGVVAVNLGTGKGVSVLELVQTFIDVNSMDIPYKIVGRRPGDVASCYAEPGLAKRLLGWEAELSLEDMCRDAWRWQKANPVGYET